VALAALAFEPLEVTVPSTPTLAISLPVYVPAGKVSVQKVPGTRYAQAPPPVSEDVTSAP
jgi:hypothetical protein